LRDQQVVDFVVVFRELLVIVGWVQFCAHGRVPNVNYFLAAYYFIAALNLLAAFLD
jgi:hypothetical protein